MVCAKSILTPLTALLAVMWATSSQAGTFDAAEVQRNLDFVWTMIAAGLVFFMQMGFLLLEAGQVRSKNAVNVAQKNLMDFAIAGLLFGAIGFGLMFGPSLGGLVGWSSDLVLFNFDDPWILTFFVFQMVFAGTAATIVSGAVAERMSMVGYGAVAALLAALIYPIAGHWSWGGLLTGDETPFLASWGFMDFAGSTVVHSVGAWAGLAAALIIGPRSGKYDADGRPVDLQGHSPVLATAGALVIWVGWIGFNGGSTTAGTPAFAGIVANTMAAGVAGTVVHFVLGRAHKGFSRPEFMINGALSGLVGITAGCDVASLQSAVVIGATASAVCYAAREWLERAGVDDPLGAVAVHGFAGAAGTVLVGVLAPAEALLAGGRLAQIGVQMAGVGLYFVWTFGLVYAALWVLTRVLPCEHDGPGRGLRVSREDEQIGLNAAEHNAPLGMASLTDGMVAILRDPDSSIDPIPEEQGDETYEAALLFNRIIALLNGRADQERERAQEVQLTLHELGAVIRRAENGDLSGRVSPGQSPEFEVISSDFNSMISKLDNVLKQMNATTDVLAEVAEHMTRQSKSVENLAQEQTDKVASLSTDLQELQSNFATNSSRMVAAQDKMQQGRELSETVRESSASMVNRIDHATEGTSEIELSINKIDDIALETKLLSLNASVEAARAGGEASKGFAIVAQEVRELAAKSAETAETVRGIIGDVVGRSQNARAEVGNTNRALDQMLKISTELSDLIAELGAVSETGKTKIERVAETIAEVEAASVAVLMDASETESLAKSLEDQSKESRRILQDFSSYAAPSDLDDEPSDSKAA